jgi:hypothetical protein
MRTGATLYAEARSWLGWPARKTVFNPKGAGPRVAAETAQKKIGSALALAFVNIEVDVGVLVTDADSDSTEALLAIVCEFRTAAGEQVLEFAHRLAWNFCRTALLITLEPHRLIAWSCYQDPLMPIEERQVCELPSPERFRPTGTVQQRKVRDLLHWVNLITRRAQRDLPAKFRAEGRADALLLKNLRHCRGKLLGMGLATEFTHALLARVIFTQFLFHRRDRDGNPFFTERLLRRLCEEGTLGRIYPDLATILGSKRDIYSLFFWMDEHFNGDLFPVKETDDEVSRDGAWRAEQNAVRKEHLTLLMEFVSGDMDTTDRQLNLWPVYSFDAIPLEFISSVYEEFLLEDKDREKAYYTPAHLVDYILDAVLPWDDRNWNVRILDPCCGSGLFLVKAFQRIIYRWLIDNRREPLVSDLKPILANNLVGIDRNPEAARVASFSLYLAMADAIEPKHYATRTGSKVFPQLRGRRIIAQDFFDESTIGIRTVEDAKQFDLVIGNAPWGDKSILSASTTISGTTRTKAQVWAKANGWPVSNNDIGPLFLAKAASMVRATGRVAMLQSGSILAQRGGPAVEFRRKLFTSFTFHEITNLSALRRSLFSSAIGPACIVVFSGTPCSDKSQFGYIAPKSADRQRDETIVVEPYDVAYVSHGEAATDPHIWPILSLGGPRDLQLVRKLLRFGNLSALERDEKVISKLGIIPGDQKQELKPLRGVPFFPDTKFPAGSFLHLETKGFLPWENPRAAATYATNPEAFRSPQLLVKLVADARSGRFRAARVRSDTDWGIVCKKSFLSVRDYGKNAQHIDRACLAYNSDVAAYFLHLTSSRGLYNSEMLLTDLRSVPIPEAAADITSFNSFDEIDQFTHRAFGLTRAEEVLIEDFLAYTLPEALRKGSVPGRSPTRRISDANVREPELSAYAQTFGRVVKATFGANKTIATVILAEPSESRLPVRMVSFNLNTEGDDSLGVESIGADGLLDQLSSFHDHQLSSRVASSGGRTGFQRVGFLLQTQHGHTQSMSLTIIKPDEVRYWTRSTAMRDADQLAGAILIAANQRSRA